MYPVIYPLSDTALAIDWGNRIDEALNGKVMGLFAHLQAARLPGVTDLIPAYSTLTLVFDPAPLYRLFPDKLPTAALQDMVEPLLVHADNRVVSNSRLVEIPVCYDPQLGPDLAALAETSGLTPAEVIRLHTAREYRVYMLGFLPGFPYLGTVDARIAAPRLPRPRPRVPAGSVGIAGAQTGIYPLVSPGGWNLIGRTPLRLFDAGQANPVWLRPGDRVRFQAISLDVFHQLQRAL